jgi:Protein of unknown function (DUF3489)
MATAKRKPKPTKHSAAPSRRKAAPKVARSVKAAAAKPKSPERAAEPIPAAVAGSVSKQDAVLGMLRQGTTISAISGATHWQTHSVRGFLASVVKKKLKLKLTSEKVDGERVYRIDESGPTA